MLVCFAFSSRFEYYVYIPIYAVSSSLAASRSLLDCRFTYYPDKINKTEVFEVVFTCAGITVTGIISFFLYIFLPNVPRSLGDLTPTYINNPSLTRTHTYIFSLYSFSPDLIIESHSSPHSLLSFSRKKESRPGPCKIYIIYGVVGIEV